eukprot:4409473-Pyramimonas_sp.AAC.1
MPTHAHAEKTRQRAQHVRHCYSQRYASGERFAKLREHKMRAMTHTIRISCIRDPSAHASNQR